MNAIGPYMPYLLIGVGFAIGFACGRGESAAVKLWNALDAADKSGEEISSQELQRRSGLGISSFYSAMDRLMKAGWVNYHDGPKAEDGSAIRYYRIVQRPSNWPLKHPN